MKFIGLAIAVHAFATACNINDGYEREIAKVVTGLFVFGSVLYVLGAFIASLTGKSERPS